MSAFVRHLRGGRVAALATLAVSAALFGTALSGIASIDPGADAAGPAVSPSVRSVSLEERRDHDCPRKRGGDPRRGDAPDRGDRPNRDGVTQ